MLIARKGSIYKHEIWDFLTGFWFNQVKQQCPIDTSFSAYNIEHVINWHFSLYNFVFHQELYVYICIQESCRQGATYYLCGLDVNLHQTIPNYINDSLVPYNVSSEAKMKHVKLTLRGRSSVEDVFFIDINDLEAFHKHRHFQRPKINYIIKRCIHLYSNIVYII